LHRGIKKLKWSYQPRCKLMNHENGGLFADFHIVSNWENYFSHLLNVRNITDVRKTEIGSAESLVTDPGTSEVEIDCEKLEKYKSSCSD
jgi:hypothetical protein